MTDYACTIVSQTHWDREWHQPFQSFRFRLVELVDQVLNLLRTDPDYHYFTLDGQAIVLEDYLEVRPEREEELSALVQAGHLLVGPWYVLPDEFLVSGEALIRNFIMGHQICARFGPIMKVGYTPDPFGHISQLPQIFCGLDIDSAVFRRGLADEPTVLWWAAADGSRVLTIYLREGYDNFAHVPDDVDGFCDLVQRQIELLGPHSPIPHLLLMNGADHMLPQPYLPRLIQAAAERLNDVRLRQGTLPDFIAFVRAEVNPDALPVVRGELRSPQRHHLLPGVLSTRMWIKQRNAHSQTLLERHAEPLAALAGYLGGADLRSQLRVAWRLLLQNHPHDSICGCSIDQVHDEMRPRFDGSDQIAEAIAQESLDFLARQIDTRLGLQTRPVDSTESVSMHPQADILAVVVFNPELGTTSGVVSVEVPAPLSGRNYRLSDETGQAIPYRWQDWPDTAIRDWSVSGSELESLLHDLARGHLLGRALHDLQYHPPGKAQPDQAVLTILLTGAGTPDMTALYRWLKAVRSQIAASPVKECTVRARLASQPTLAFVAPAVPGPGYRTFWLETVPAVAPPTPSQTKRGEGRSIANEYFRVTAETDGSLTLQDRRTGAVFHGLNRFVDNGDAGDEYNHCPPLDDSVVTRPAAPPAIHCLDEGPLGQGLEIRQHYHLPASLTPDRQARSQETVEVPIGSRAWLRPGVPRLDIATRVDNQAEDHRLRVLFPSGIQAGHVLAEGQFDLVLRGPHGSGPLPANTADWVEQPVATQPQQTFVAVQAGESHGLLLANRGLPEYEALDEDGEITLALTLLRCVGWLSRDDFHCRTGQAGPQLPTPAAQCPGPATFHYSLIPFTELTAAAQQAWAFNAGLRAIAAPVSSGPLAPIGRPIAVEPAALSLSALKPAEDGSGLILRFFNSLDEPVEGRLTFELPVGEAWRVNLLEEKQDRLQLGGDGTLALSVQGKEIVTIRFEPGRE